MAVRVLLLLVAWTLWTSVTTANVGIYARDGNGRPVSWFVVYKLPMVARRGTNTTELTPTPCNCAPPNCTQLPTASLNVTARATGLCYLYADSNNATLRHFRELGYDCLGQGGNDPVSHTLRQIYHGSSNTTAPTAPYWAIFNDQLNGIAERYVPPPSVSVPQPNNATRVCAGGDVFSAHAKGAVAFDGHDGGFVLQTSTPNFPDPSRLETSSRSDPFIPLGCQKDNNVQFAQHVLALSMDMTALNALGTQLQVARLCAGNFYHDLRTSLASEQLLLDGASPERNANFRELYQALLNTSLESFESSPTLKIQLRAVEPVRASRSRVFAPVYPGQSLLRLEDEEAATQASSSTGAPVITVTVKTPQAAVPPWALLAEAVASDMSVASWWDGSYGIPNICAGDLYTNTTTNHFCLDNAAHGVHLFSNGSAKFNVENLIEAAWVLPNSSEKVHWHLVGGSHKDGNHAKWGVSTPRYGPGVNQSRLVTFADLNMEGFPCSTTCHGSQAGRGGSFFTFDDPQLHASFVDSLITKACPCIPPPTEATTASFEVVRMCHMGCWRKVQDHFQPQELPVMASDASSFWHPST